LSLTCFCYWSAQGGVGPQIGCGIGVSNCVIPRAEPADTIAASKTRRKAFFTVMFSFDLSSQTVSDILAYIRNKAMDLMRVPNPQQKIPKMGIAVFSFLNSRVERRSFPREQGWLQVFWALLRPTNPLRGSP